MEVVAGVLAFLAFRRTGPTGSVNSDLGLTCVGLVDVELNEDAVARRVGQDLERELLGLQPLEFGVIRPFGRSRVSPRVNGPSQVDYALVEVLLRRIDSVFFLASDGDRLQAGLRFKRNKSDRSRDLRRFAR